MKKIIVFAIVVIDILNLPPVHWLFGQEDLLYSNATGTFTFDEANISGRNYELCLDNFQAFKSIQKKDTLLYRVTPINILSFWRWSDYITREKYKLPFRSWKEIEAVRGTIGNKTNWQAF